LTVDGCLPELPKGDISDIPSQLDLA